MGDFELLQQMKTGDSTAFKQWMNKHAENIERFAIQFGCTQKQAGTVAEATFRTLYHNIKLFNDDDSMSTRLYQIALEQLVHENEKELQLEKTFSFEEDQELHEKIGQLEKKSKVCFILSQFQEKTDEEIAMIVGMSEEAVCMLITQAYEVLAVQIEGHRLEKRLEFLTKSYGRISSFFRQEKVFEEPKLEEQTSKTRRKVSRKSIVTWIAGIVVLFVLVSVPVVMGEEYQKASSEKYLEKLTTSFGEEMTSRFNILGLTEPTDKDDEDFHGIPFGQQARGEFETLIRKAELEIVKNNTIDKKMIGEQYEEIIKTLELPSEKAEKLFKNPLTNDKDKSEKFLTDYFNQFFEIQQSYYTSIFKHEEIIQNAIVDGTVDIEKFIEKNETYPEDLKMAIDGMKGQNVYLYSIPEWASVFPNFGTSEVSAKIRASIHEDLVGYITAMESWQFIYNTNQDISIDEAIDALIEIEKTIFASDEKNNHYFTLDYYYSALFNRIVIETEPNQFLGPDGKVREEIRASWKRIASIGGDSPAAHIMRKIIAEMETSGWTKSESQRRLHEYQIQQALEMAKEGNLESFVIHGITQVNGLHFVAFPDVYFENIVEETYNHFSSNHDLVLKEVDPLVIAAIYFYANDQEDPETMWRLFSREHNAVTLEEYENDWKKIDFNLYAIDSLHFEDGGSSKGTIGFRKGNETTYNLHMSLNGDVWEIENLYLD